MEFGHIVLASASPRRKELLLQIGIEPETVVSGIKESVTSKIPSEVVMELAAQKARDVAKSAEPGTVVIGADTVVAVDGTILGKPKTHGEAEEMVRRLSGRTHQVYTGVCLIRKDADGSRERIFFDEADVEVDFMSDGEIRDYAQSDEPMDKAGAYAVQGFFARYIKGIRGTHANVMGLPVNRVYRELKLLAGGEDA